MTAVTDSVVGIGPPGPRLCSSVPTFDLTSAVLLLGWAFLSNVAIAVVPHEPAVILAGGTLGVPVTVVAATIGTILAAWADHRMFGGWLASRPRPTEGATAWLLDRFEYAPFLVLTVGGLLPLPAWPFKVLALSAGYPRLKYVAAQTAGRVPRYLLLATFGYALALPPAVLVAISVVMGVIFSLPMLRARWRKRDE